MKYYQDLAQFPAFTLNDAMQVMGGGACNAPQILNAMVKKGSVRRIRQNLYTCADYVNGGDVATRFDIASKITPSSFVAYHSAFEFYGFYNQVFSVVQVCSQSRFTNFEDNGYSYRYFASDLPNQVDTLRGVRVTSIERTIVDSINMLGKVMDTEELLKCIELIRLVNEQKIKDMLLLYNKDILFRKVGYILSYFKEEFRLSDEFFDFCRKQSDTSHIGFLCSNEIRKLEFIGQWGLYAFKDLRAITGKGGDADV
ncbi:MAG: hypothetical protein IK091_08665 [Spirochaetales bacterium]|nr:hypothetical protein [Spirochaetales bacterium]